MFFFLNKICQENEKIKMTEKAGRETPGEDGWFQCVSLVAGLPCTCSLFLLPVLIGPQRVSEYDDISI